VIVPFILLLIAVCLSVTGELFFKSGMNQIGVLSFSNLWSMVPRMATHAKILTGATCFVAGGLFWLSVLSRVNLSWAYPMLSLGYVLVLLFSGLILHEQVSSIRWVGALVICVGVYLISRS
jgi:drug/metabolite transporter (DMT)-like permease